MLYTADICQPQFRPPSQQRIAVITAVRITVQRNHGFHADNCILCLNHPIRVIKSSVTGAFFIHFLRPQTAGHPFLGVLQYFFIMFFHCYTPPISSGCQSIPPFRPISSEALHLPVHYSRTPRLRQTDLQEQRYICTQIQSYGSLHPHHRSVHPL